MHRRNSYLKTDSQQANSVKWQKYLRKIIPSILIASALVSIVLLGKVIFFSKPSIIPTVNRSPDMILKLRKNHPTNLVIENRKLSLPDKKLQTTQSP